MSKPRVVLIDIETALNVVTSFSLREEFLPHTGILQERYIICGCWKVLGERRVHSVSVLDDAARYKRNPHDDQHVVETLHKVLSEADVVVAHNGDRFDFKWIAGRVLALGLPPFPPLTSIDTYKAAKKHFYLNSYRLDYLGRYLGVGRKVDTPKGLWMQVVRGDREAVRTMTRYCKGDVTLLEDVFLKMAPFLSNGVNLHLYGGKNPCPRCDSAKVRAQGTRRAKNRVFQRYQCSDCGGWFQHTKPEKGVTSPVTLL